MQDQGSAAAPERGGTSRVGLRGRAHHGRWLAWASQREHDPLAMCNMLRRQVRRLVLVRVEARSTGSHGFAGLLE